jgi:hypothetical protein
MPCHDAGAVLAFPPDFSPHTNAFHSALAEHNWRRSVAGLPHLSFLDLEREEQTLVLARAGELRGPAGAPSSSGAAQSDHPAGLETAPPAEAAPEKFRHSWWVRALLALDRGLDRVGSWFWGPNA